MHCYNILTMLYKSIGQLDSHYCCCCNYNYLFIIIIGIFNIFLLNLTFYNNNTYIIYIYFGNNI